MTVGQEYGPVSLKDNEGNRKDWRKETTLSIAEYS